MSKFSSQSVQWFLRCRDNSVNEKVDFGFYNIRITFFRSISSIETVTYTTMKLEVGITNRLGNIELRIMHATFPHKWVLMCSIVYHMHLNLETQLAYECEMKV